MAANPFDDKEKEEAIKQNLIEHKAVIIFDRDNTLVEDGNQNADYAKAINRDQLEILFRYFILKNIPVGFVSSGSNTAGYKGDERLDDIRFLYSAENRPGYFIGKGLKYLENVHMPEACLPNSLEITPMAGSDFENFTQDSNAFKIFFIEFVSRGQYNSDTYELSYTDQRRKAIFKVKINPEHTFEINLADADGNSGLVLTINVHALLTGGYEEIGAAKGKIFGCLKMLAEMHIVPILDREMRSVGIVAIKGPDHYARVKISKVAMVDDEDVIVQNLGRAGLSTILADTEARYRSLLKDPQHKIEQNMDRIEKCRKKIAAASEENRKSELLNSCINLLNTVVNLYQGEIAAEGRHEIIKQLKDKSTELRKLDPHKLSSDANRLDRHVQNLENLDIDRDKKVDHAKMDSNNFFNRAGAFSVDIDAVQREIEEYEIEIAKCKEKLTELDEPAQKITNNYLDKLAQHLGFASMFALEETIGQNIDLGCILRNFKNEIQTYSPLIDLNEKSRSQSFFKAAGHVLKAVTGKEFIKAKLIVLWKGLNEKQDCIHMLRYIREQKEQNSAYPEYVAILINLEKTCLQEIDGAILYMSTLKADKLEQNSNVSSHSNSPSCSNSSSSVKVNSSVNSSSSSFLSLPQPLSQKEQKLKIVKDMLCKEFESKLHQNIKAATGWRDLEILLAQRERDNTPKLSRGFFDDIYEDIDRIYELPQGTTKNGMVTRIEIDEENGTSNAPRNGK